MRHPILAPNSTFWIHLFFKTYSEMPILCKFFCNPSSQVFLKFQFTFVRILEFKHYNANSRVSGRDLISHLTARFEQRRDRKQNQRIFMAEHLLVAWHSRRTLVYVKPFWYNTGTWRTEGQTDGRTDSIPISISLGSVLTRDKYLFRISILVDLRYRVKQNKISQRKNRDTCIYIMQEYFYTKFSTFIQQICLHKLL